MNVESKPLGGYFELELPVGKEYHEQAIKLNNGRNAIEYIISSRGYTKIYLPYYTCDVILQPVIREKCQFEFYHITPSFIPIFDFQRLGQNETFLYTNYFGINDHHVLEISRKCKNVIVDNSQAFYSKPINGVDTFYSPRKYFGVPDGGYLYCNKLTQQPLKRDFSYSRFSHLLKRIDLDPESGYIDSRMNDESTNGVSMRIMSRLTQRLLQSINYEMAAQIRKENFTFLHEYLGQLNELNIDLIRMEESVPMAYPLLINRKGLKAFLLKERVFIPTYWENVFQWVPGDNYEHYLAKNLLALPVDQRYDLNNMRDLVSLINLY